MIRYTNEIVLNQIDQVRERVQWELEHEKETDAYPRSSTTPLKGGLEHETSASAPFKGLLIPSGEKGSAAETATSAPFKGLLIPSGEKGSAAETRPPVFDHPLERVTDTITLFTHGRLEPGKGIDMIVRVFERLQGMKNEGMNNAQEKSING